MAEVVVGVDDSGTCLTITALDKDGNVLLINPDVDEWTLNQIEDQLVQTDLVRDSEQRRSE